MELRQSIINLIEDKSYTKKTASEISSFLNVEADNFKEFVKLINELEDEGIIYISKNGYVHNAKKLGIYIGKIKVTRRYSALVETTEGETLTIENEFLDNAYTGDTVRIHKLKDNSAEVIEVVKRNLWQLVANYNNKKFYVEEKNFPYDIKVKYDNNHLVNGHVVLLKVKSYDNFTINCEVDKILGHKNDPGVDILSSIIRANVKYEFDDKLLKETNKVIDNKLALLDVELASRKDLTNELIVTIDGLEAKDLDDAISLSIKDNGNFELGVHIADVSHFVTSDSLLDKEAFTRGTSIYLCDRVIPMLPQAISNGVCSLNPNEIKLTMSCIMEVDNEGNVVDYEITPSYIKSKARLDYDDVNNLFNKKQTVKTYSSELKAMLFNCKILSSILTKKMLARGYLSLNVPEAKFVMDENTKKVKDIKLREQLDAEKLIENFMILANETVASHVYYMSLPFIYRVHKEPTTEKLELMVSNLKDIGIPFNIKGNYLSTKMIQDILVGVKHKETEGLVSDTILRCLSKAYYSPINEGHFGLGSSCYTHFTSPIRRYPDLIVHRFLKKYLVNNDFSDESEFLIHASDNSSITERKAIDLEREVEDIKKAEYMSNYIGETFKGSVVSILDFGMFVRLENTCEGLLRYELIDLGSYHDFSYYKNHFKVGEIIDVKVIGTNIPSGEINFAYINKKTYNNKKEKRK